MAAEDPYAGLIVQAANRADLGVVVAYLTPPAIEHANATALRMFGVTFDELRKRAPFDFVPPEQRDLVSDRLKRRLAGEILPPPELTIARPDGTRILAECRIVDLEMEGRPAAAVFLSERTPAANLAADTRYRDLVDAGPDGVAITRGTKFLYANRAALSVVGCATFEELSRHTLDEFLSDEDVRIMKERTTAMMRDGARFRPRDYVIRGRKRHVIIEVCSMAIDFEGAPAILAFMRDVTEMRRTQAELVRGQRLTALGTIVAGVAHEVNNPLAFAKLAAERLTRLIDASGDADAGQAALSDVIAGLDRIAALVRDLRTFVRADEAVWVPTELDDVLASALRMTSPTIKTRAKLDVELETLPTVRSSAGRLEQVFVNLLINAAQAFARDDVANNVVRVRASQKPDAVAVTIDDNGRGIGTEHVSRVFDPFFTTKAAGEGTGLGLSICHAIVTQHGGRIDIASVVGAGTTVTVVLPVHTAGRLATAASEVSAPAAVTTRRARVLIVDDEPALAQLLGAMLSECHDVTVATSGLAAQKLLLEREPTFEVVLCDLTMPDISGLALFESVCARKPELRRRFAFMSGGFFSEELLQRAGASEAPRLEKPFSSAAVSETIAQVMGEPR